MADFTPAKGKKHTVFGDPSGIRSGTATVGDRTYETFKPKPFNKSPELTKRSEYEDISRAKYGAPKTRPYMSERDISSKVDSLTSATELEAWDYVFGDNVRYEDRKHLSSKQRTEWTTALLQVRKNADKQIRDDLTSRQDEHDQKQGRVDAEMEVYDKYQTGKKETITDKEDRLDNRARRRKELEKEFATPKAAKTKYTVLQIYDFIDEVEGSGEPITPNQQAVLDEMTKDHDFKVINNITQYKKERWWIIPDTEQIGGLEMVPKGADMTPAKAQKPDNEIAEILKQNGYPVTPENIAKFRANNPG